MKTTKELSDRLKEVLLVGKWISNTNYKEQVLDVNWIESKQKVGSLNSIAALIYHINYYLKGILDAVENGKLEISDKYSFDLSPIETKDDWEKLTTEFLFHAERFVMMVSMMDDEVLSKPFVDEKYGTYLRNIEGVIEHSYYHLGQILILKKLIRAT